MPKIFYRLWHNASFCESFWIQFMTLNMMLCIRYRKEQNRECYERLPLLPKHGNYKVLFCFQQKFQMISKTFYEQFANKILFFYRMLTTCLKFVTFENCVLFFYIFYKKALFYFKALRLFVRAIIIWLIMSK